MARRGVDKATEFLRKIRPFTALQQWSFVKNATFNDSLCFQGHAFVQEELHRRWTFQQSLVDAVRGTRVSNTAADVLTQGLQNALDEVYTEPNSRRKALKQANRLVSRADALHECYHRFLELMRTDYADEMALSPTAEHWLDVQTVCFQSCSLLVRQLQTASESASDRQDPHHHAAPMRPADMLLLAEHCAADARVFCSEKHGVAPEVVVQSDIPGEHCTVVAPTPCLQFALMELLKNSLHATVKHVGQLNVDDGPPVRILLHQSRRLVGWEIRDYGGGCDDPEGSLRYFHTAVKARENPDYKYSREFGAAMAGLGVGLPLARATLRVAGGKHGWVSLPGAGSTSVVTVPLDGMQPDIPHAWASELLHRLV